MEKRLHLYVERAATVHQKTHKREYAMDTGVWQQMEKYSKRRMQVRKDCEQRDDNDGGIRGFKKISKFAEKKKN